MNQLLSYAYRKQENLYSTKQNIAASFDFIAACDRREGVILYALVCCSLGYEINCVVYFPEDFEKYYKVIHINEQHVKRTAFFALFCAAAYFAVCVDKALGSF